MNLLMRHVVDKITVPTVILLHLGFIDITAAQ